MRRSITTLLLAQAFFLVVAHCCCWLPDGGMACDASTDPKACCCENEGSITMEPPSLTATLLPVPALLGPAAAGEGLPRGHSLHTSFASHRSLDSADILQHRAPPLYLLNASILI